MNAVTFMLMQAGGQGDKKMKISVALCTYNGELYIEQQLKSIIRQSHHVNEIVISDDGSTDSTLEIIESLAKKVRDVEFKIFKHGKPVGPAKNFWECIKKCTGEIIFTCDQDDVWVNDKVELMLEHFKDDVVLVFSDAVLVDQDLNDLHDSLWNTINFKGDEKNLFSIFLNRNVVTGATMAIKKNIVNETTAVPDGFLHDQWIAINALRFGKIVAVKEKLIYYRQHSQNVVGARRRSVLEKLKQYVQSSENMATCRKNRVNYYGEYLKLAKSDLPEDDIFKLKECVCFWNGTTELDEKGKWSGLCWIAKNLLNGNYGRYFTGVPGALRDMILKLKIKENKKRNYLDRT